MRFLLEIAAVDKLYVRVVAPLAARVANDVACREVCDLHIRCVSECCHAGGAGWPGRPDAASHAWQTWSYATRGRYAEQLRDWLAVVPRERLLVLRSEDLYRDPAATVREATDFLGLPPAPLADRTVHNERRCPPMAPAVRAKLSEEFRPRNRELEALLGREMGWDGPEA